jgi:hypothetical protein
MGELLKLSAVERTVLRKEDNLAEQDAREESQRNMKSIGSKLSVKECSRFDNMPYVVALGNFWGKSVVN